MKHPIIALLTDFGNGDFFVGSMKGVIAGIAPAASVIDITHSIPSYNVGAAAFVVKAGFRCFPKGRVFVVVVDPGVGSDRRVLLVKTQDYAFIAPDNGVLSLVLEEDPPEDMSEVSDPKYFLPEVSHTFEARDRMAPAAAWLVSGIPINKFGPVATAYEKLEPAIPERREADIRGEVLYTDKFGNLITNIPVAWLDDHAREDREELVMLVGENTICYKHSYAEVGKEDLLYLPGSLGLVEIAVREGSAADRLNLHPGASVHITRKVRPPGGPQ